MELIKEFAEVIRGQRNRPEQPVFPSQICLQLTKRSQPVSSYSLGVLPSAPVRRRLCPGFCTLRAPFWPCPWVHGTKGTCLPGTYARPLDVSPWDHGIPYPNVPKTTFRACTGFYSKTIPPTVDCTICVLTILLTIDQRVIVCWACEWSSAMWLSCLCVYMCATWVSQRPDRPGGK